MTQRVQLALYRGALLLTLAALVVVVARHPAQPGRDSVEAASVTDPAGAADAVRLGQAFAAAAETAAPAVVNIAATVPRPRSMMEEFLGGGFRGMPEAVSESLGSGVIIDPRGYVVTNNHVVAGAEQIRVSLQDNREFDATVQGADPTTDIAVLKIEADGLPSIQWADTDALKVGEWVIAIGSPFGLNHTITAGIVSAKGRVDVELSGYTEFIQTDAAINPGNSGGALVDIYGRLVGINTAIASNTGGYQGIGFAIPSSEARPIVDTLVRTGKVDHGFIGVITTPLTPWLQRRAGVEGKEGELVVAQMYEDSPAHKAGLEPGDVVEQVAGVAMDSQHTLAKTISDQVPGGKVDAVVRRAGKRYKATLSVIAHPIDRRGRPVPGA